MTTHIVRTNGLFSLYNGILEITTIMPLFCLNYVCFDIHKGISAALLMSGTYSTARFAFYEYFKEILLNYTRNTRGDYSINDLSFYQKIIIAGGGGAVGAAVGIYRTFLKVELPINVHYKLFLIIFTENVYFRPDLYKKR